MHSTHHAPNLLLARHRGSFELSARVLQHGCCFCFVFMLSDAFPQVHWFVLVFCFLCFFFWCCVLKFALTACLRSTAVNVLFGHVPRSAIRFGATLSQLPSCRAVWGGLSASHQTAMYRTALLQLPAWGTTTCPMPLWGGGESPGPPVNQHRTAAQLAWQWTAGVCSMLAVRA
jgi:hypothetical protein